MRRAQAYRSEIGKAAIVYLREGWVPTVSGVLSIVTDEDVILEVADAEGYYVGMRHTIPWDSVHRVMTIDQESLDSLMDDVEDADVPEAPGWVLEVLAEADDGAV